MSKYQSSSELKALSKEQLFGKYGTLIGASLLMSLCTVSVMLIATFLSNTTTVLGLIFDQVIYFIISILSGLFSSGLAFLYLKLICGQPISVGDIFYGFRFHPDKALILQFWISLPIFIINIPFTIFSFSYSSTGSSLYFLGFCITWVMAMAVFIYISLLLAPAFYLLHDFPNYSVRTLIQMSFGLMKGHKGRLFYIMLSYIPLILLGFLSCCIANLWIMPYINATYANFYMDLMKNREKTPVDTAENLSE